MLGGSDSRGLVLDEEEIEVELGFGVMAIGFEAGSVHGTEVDELEARGSFELPKTRVSLVFPKTL